MLNAVADVRAGLTVRAAAEKHGVAKSTLQDKCHGFHKAPRGRPTNLTPFEENVLVSLARGREIFGVPYTPDTFTATVREYAEKKCILFFKLHTDKSSEF